VRLHPVSDVLAGLIVYPWSDAIRVWTQVDDILADGPDALTVQTGILPGPDGGPTQRFSRRSGAATWRPAKAPSGGCCGWVLR